MPLRFAWLVALALSLAACSGEKNIDGFKDTKFGATEAASIKLGFECPATTRQCSQPKARSTKIRPIDGSHISAANIERGAQAFRRCATCHTSSKGGENGIGPNLWSVVGDDIGAPSRGFAFSTALAEKQGKWDASALDAFLSDPSAFAPGSKMISGSLEDPQMRADIISYLNSQSAHPIALALSASTPTASPSAQIYTLFGKNGSITVDLGKEGVDAISVSIEMPVEQLTELYAKQYGAPLSFSDTDLFGGRLTRFYWRFENGTAIVVTKRETKGPLQPRVPAWLAADENAFSSALYLAPGRAAQMLSRAKGNQVNASDL